MEALERVSPVPIRYEGMEGDRKGYFIDMASKIFLPFPVPGNICCARTLHLYEPKRTEKQKVKEITDRLEEGLKELFEGEKYKSYLNTMCIGSFVTGSIFSRSSLNL